jgi:hypothetical protein
MKWPRTEQDLGKAVVQYLKHHGWTVYQEVQLGNHICDILAVKDSVYWAIECKRSFSLDLIGQAYMWRGYVNQTSVAVPRKKTSRALQMAEMFCRHLGIGVLYFYPDRLENNRYSRDIGPKRDDRDMAANWSFLTDRHKDYAPAGNADGKRLTKFANTCINLRNVLRHFPDGLPIKELVSFTEHHYASDHSAKTALAIMVARGVVDGVWRKRDGKRFIYFLTEED